MIDRLPLDAVLPDLRCPVCRAGLGRDDRTVRCISGHAFDLARQGYLNLAVGQRAGTADSAAMVAARDQFLAAGHFLPIAEAVVDAVGGLSGLALDLAGGTGWYLAAVVAATGGVGVCLDLSPAALRRAARVHPRVAAVGTDAWRPLPFAGGCAAVVLSIFGPRDPAEIARVLAPGGRLVTVSPRPRHLGELAGPLGLIGIDPRKPERTADAFAAFDQLSAQRVGYALELGRSDCHAVAAMGPSARHVPDEELTARVTTLAERTAVSVDVDVRTYATPR